MGDITQHTPSAAFSHISASQLLCAKPCAPIASSLRLLKTSSIMQHGVACLKAPENWQLLGEHLLDPFFVRLEAWHQNAMWQCRSLMSGGILCAEWITGKPTFQLELSCVKCLPALNCLQLRAPGSSSSTASPSCFHDLVRHSSDAAARRFASIPDWWSPHPPHPGNC